MIIISVVRIQSLLLRRHSSPITWKLSTMPTVNLAKGTSRLNIRTCQTSMNVVSRLYQDRLSREAIRYSIGPLCEQATETRLDELRRLILPNSQQASSPSASNLVISPTTQNLIEAGSINPLDIRRGRRRRRITSENKGNRAGHKRSRRSVHDGRAKKKSAYADQDKEDKIVTDKIIKKIHNALKNLEGKAGISFPPTPNTNETPKALGFPNGINNHHSAQLSKSVT